MADQLEAVDFALAAYREEGEWQVQELAHTGSLLPQHVEALSSLLQETHLGQQIVAFKIWDADGRVLYSTDSALIGRVTKMVGSPSENSMARRRCSSSIGPSTKPSSSGAGSKSSLMNR